MSAPLRPAPEEHLPAIPPATLDETFSEEAFSAWLQQDNLSNKRWVWPEGEEDADERTALIAHRKRRGDLYKPDLRRPEGPPRIITANGLPSRSPSLSPISPKRRHYGSVAGSESGEESVTSDRRSPRFLRRRRRRKVEGGINEPWTWDTSWLNPRVSDPPPHARAFRHAYIALLGLVDRCATIIMLFPNPTRRRGRLMFTPCATGLFSLRPCSFYQCFNPRLLSVHMSALCHV